MDKENKLLKLDVGKKPVVDYIMRGYMNEHILFYSPIEVNLSQL